MYFFKSNFEDIRLAQLAFRKQTKTKRLVLGAFLSSIAAVLQAAGGFLPGVGYFISPFATGPILLCSMLSLPLGAISFLLSNLLLLILQPSEIIVFPFTTGLLGLGIGAAFYFFKKRLSLIVASSTLLTLGIIFLLYVLQFPVLGPAVSASFSLLTTSGIFLFALMYSWIWVDIGFLFLRKIKTIIKL
ncbi:hypothetical protein [Bacillus sp. 1NLA3E]|uniref:hypothetical protein n=1 Tax=Bacillus sp. 1NLA3E TaxID=666686 RepID=UPI000247F049|nr:hypothetical protein [Bacillus sp. 1NLA3E]AGK54008.1 hypothetical protein B1NLA3E_11280 [Bacillus sp. 1NLA3E]